MFPRDVDRSIPDESRIERSTRSWTSGMPFSGREWLLIVGACVGVHAALSATQRIAPCQPPAWFDTVILGATIVGTLLWIHRRRSAGSERPPIAGRRAGNARRSVE